MRLDVYRVTVAAIGILGLVQVVIGSASAIVIAVSLRPSLARAKGLDYFSIWPLVLLMMGAVVALGVVPGALFIIFRRWIARRLSTDEIEPSMPEISFPSLSKLAISLVAISFLVMAVHELASGLAYSQTGTSSEGLWPMLAGPLVYGGAGVILLLGAGKLSHRWREP